MFHTEAFQVFGDIKAHEITYYESNYETNFPLLSLIILGMKRQWPCCFLFCQVKIQSSWLGSVVLSHLTWEVHQFTMMQIRTFAWHQNRFFLVESSEVTRRHWCTKICLREGNSGWQVTAMSWIKHHVWLENKFTVLSERVMQHEGILGGSLIFHSQIYQCERQTTSASEKPPVCGFSINDVLSKPHPNPPRTLSETLWCEAASCWRWMSLFWPCWHTWILSRQCSLAHNSL